jgi:hypothetical protein
LLIHILVPFSARLGQRVGEHRLPACHRRQVLPLQLFGAGQQQRDRAELVHRGDQRGSGARARDLLDDDHGGERVGALATVFRGDVRGVQPGPGQRVQRLGREPAGRVHVGGRRGDLGLRQLADRLPQQLVVFRQVVHQRCS